MNINATKDGTNNATVTLNGNTGNIIAGGEEEQGGSLILKDSTGVARVVIVSSLIDPEEFGAGFAGKWTIRLDGRTADLFLGGAGKDGALTLREGATGKNTIFIDGGKAGLFLGGGGQDGAVTLREGATGKNTIFIDGGKADLFLGGGGQDGAVTLREGATGKNTIFIDGGKADLFLGGGGQDGRVTLREGTGGADTLILDGKTGDIILQNADCAEEFDVAEATEVEPGTVMVLDQEGKLQPSQQAYDKKVAGVISGARELKPGIILDKKPGRKNRLPLAMVGKVYCKADSSFAPIEIGDLLTTSPTPGYAMKVADPARAFGAVIGKALSPLSKGANLIPILIALQ
jgi:hypothetical protein